MRMRLYILILFLASIKISIAMESYNESSEASSTQTVIPTQEESTLSEKLFFVCRQSNYPNKPLCYGCYKRANTHTLSALRAARRKAQSPVQ